MGECYWHGYEVYPGNECPECEKERALIKIKNRNWRLLRERGVKDNKHKKED